LKTSELISLKGLYLLVENDFQGAINCFNKCANIYKKIKGDNNFEFATTINNIGLVHYHSGNFNNAKECWEQTILILNSLGMRNHPKKNSPK
jgi:tetratricopeptide (TPR) repeat protein